MIDINQRIILLYVVSIVMWLFPDKPNPTLQILQTLRGQIQKITLIDERKNFESERKELSKIYSRNINILSKILHLIYNEEDLIYYKKKNKQDVKTAVDELNSRVERYIKIQPKKDRDDEESDNDYSKIIEHLAQKDIRNEAEITEICNDLDKRIVFKYVQIEIIKIKEEIINRIYENLDSAKKHYLTSKDVVSEKRDANDLRTYWIHLFINKKNDKVTALEKKYNNLRNNVIDLKILELKAIEQYSSSLTNDLICLENYGTNYLSESSFERYMQIVKEYIQTINIYIPEIKDVSDGLNIHQVSIETELKNCLRNEEDIKAIKVNVNQIKNSVINIVHNRILNGQ